MEEAHGAVRLGASKREAWSGRSKTHLHLALEHVAGRQGMPVLALLAIRARPEPTELATFLSTSGSLCHAQLLHLTNSR